MQLANLQGFECQAKERGLVRFSFLKNPGGWDTSFGGHFFNLSLSQTREQGVSSQQEDGIWASIWAHGCPFPCSPSFRPLLLLATPEVSSQKLGVWDLCPLLRGQV